jgi:hypothetical protein
MRRWMFDGERRRSSKSVPSNARFCLDLASYLERGEESDGEPGTITQIPGECVSASAIDTGIVTVCQGHYLPKSAPSRLCEVARERPSVSVDAERDQQKSRHGTMPHWQFRRTVGRFAIAR